MSRSMDEQERQRLTEQWRRAGAEARFWREACERQAKLAREVAHYTGANVPAVMAFTLGKIAAGPERPNAGVMAPDAVKDTALPPIAP